MKLSFLPLIKISWSMIWRIFVAASTIMLYGFMVFTFLLMGSAITGHAELINRYISIHHHDLKVLFSQQTILSLILLHLIIYLFLAPIYYQAFTKLNHLAFKTFFLQFQKDHRPSSSLKIFVLFYGIFRTLDLTFLMGSWLTAFEAFSDFSEIIALILSFYLFTRFKVLGFHLALLPKSSQNLRQHNL
jgi:hypothetical protein